MHRASCPAFPPGMVFHRPGSSRHRPVPFGIGGVLAQHESAGMAAWKAAHKDEVAGSHTRKDAEAWMPLAKDDAAGRRKRKDEAAGCRTGPRRNGGAPGREAQHAAPRIRGPRTRQDAVEAGRIRGASGRDAWRGRSCKRPAPRIFAPGGGWFLRFRTATPHACNARRRVAQKAGANGGAQGALDRMRR